MPDPSATCEGSANLFIAVATGVSAIAAAVSAWQARQAAVQAKRSVEADLLNQSLRYYSSPEFHDAMTEIENWCTAQQHRFIDEFRELWFAERARVESVNRARRIISHYFRQMHSLWKTGAFSRSMISAVVTKEKVQFLRRAIEPLDLAIDPEQDRTVFTDFGDLHDVSPYDANLIMERRGRHGSA